MARDRLVRSGPLLEGGALVSFDLDRLDLDPTFVGTCAWCSYPVYDDDEYVDGDDGEGVMHAECSEVPDEDP